MTVSEMEAAMVLNLLLMWAVVIATLVWFVRDERRRAEERRFRRLAAMVRSARPPVRIPPRAMPLAPVPALPHRTGGLSEQQRVFFAKLADINRAAAHQAGTASGR